MQNGLNYQGVSYILEIVRGESTLDSNSESALKVGEVIQRDAKGTMQIEKWEILGFAEAKVWWMAYSDDPNAEGSWYEDDEELANEQAVIMRMDARYAIARTSEIEGLKKSAEGFKSLKTGVWGC